MFDTLKNDNVKFYFIFERNNLISAHVPQEVKDFIYKPSKENVMKIEYKKIKEQSYELDDLLDKIEKMGMESLTPEEKKFLDNFEK